MSDREMRLTTHENQHGYGVSLTVYVDGVLENGFVLRCFDHPAERQAWIDDLQDVTGYRVEDIMKETRQ